MSFSVNRVTLLGTLGRDPETRSTQAGKSVSNLNVATEQSWKDKDSGEWKNKTEWHRVTVWGADKLVEKLSKGSKVYLEGSLQTRKWTDQQGQEKYATEVVIQAGAGTIIPLDKMFKEIDAMNQSQKTSKVFPKPTEDDDSDHIPF
jgi:single-strand DNA-binding protein